MKKIILLTGLWCAAQLFAQAPQVTNVRYEQRTDGSLVVDVYYDISGIKNVDISVTASGDNGGNWTLPCNSLTGDFGSEISPGSDKHIIWDFYADNPDMTGNGFVVRVTADDDLTTGTMTDYDGHVYRTVKIGDQWWMAENLWVTHYRNGDEIPNVTDNDEWNGLTSGAYCYYSNSGSYAATYGALYNWYAIDDSRGLAPNGWHVPTDSEWQMLVNNLGGDFYAGGKLKEQGLSYWFSPNYGATNESGFSSRAAGHRSYSSGYFYSMGHYAYLWSKTEENSAEAWCRDLDFSTNVVNHNSPPKQNGFSIRCVKN